MPKKRSNNPPRYTPSRREICGLSLAMADNYHRYSRYDDQYTAIARWILGYSPFCPLQKYYRKEEARK